jgi:demethylmenaquinone methyltransferase / 2-methoxy-6-polyprenyl-1,4-benzoquinol methylase
MEKRLIPGDSRAANREIRSTPERYLPVAEATDEQRVGMVKDIFATVTEKYDFLNHLLSLRRDIAWRRFTVRKMRFFDTHRFLDVATGTADLAIDGARKCPDISVTGLDLVKEMLDVGRVKISSKELGDRIDLMQGNALRMPFHDSTFDVAAVAFGIRNIPDRLAALREMTRVVVPKGQVMVLEMSFTKNWFSRFMYHTYLNRILPVIGRVFSLNPGAYGYLADSIMNFPSRQDFVKIMETAGLVRVEAYKLTFGITYLYVGVKREPKNQ